MPGGHRRQGPYLVALLFCLLSAPTLRADPIDIGDLSTAQPSTILTILGAILLEAICINFMLRKRRKPRFLIGWLMGVHLLTYPFFVAFVWCLRSWHPFVSAGVGEAIIIVVEGLGIYLICRFVPSKSDKPRATILFSIFASLIGNIVSMVAFPLLLLLFQKMPPVEINHEVKE